MSSAERRDGGDWKRIELQLDTAQILIVIAMLFGLCATSFYLGRWIERDRWSELPAKNGASTAKLTDSGSGDLTFFDTLGDGSAEPGRQVRSAPAPAVTPPRPVPEGPDAAEGPDLSPEPPARVGAAPARPSQTPPVASPAVSAPGGYSIQVFAGDKAQAEKIAASLGRKGYSARVVPGASSKSARVRILGYRTKGDATRAADRLKKEDNLTPWVLKAD